MDVPIESLYQNLNLTDQEDDIFHMDDQELGAMVARTDKCLVLRILTDKYYNTQAFWHTMKRAWKLPQEVRFRDLGGQISLAKFTCI